MKYVIRFFTFEEALKELDGFEFPYEIKKKDLELQAIPRGVFSHYIKSGSRAFINEDRHLFINIGEKYFLYVGTYADGLVLTRYPVAGLGLSVDTITKVLTTPRTHSDKRFMERFKSRLYNEHLKLLEESELIEKTLIPLTPEMVDKFSSQ